MSGVGGGEGGVAKSEADQLQKVFDSEWRDGRVRLLGGTERGSSEQVPCMLTVALAMTKNQGDGLAGLAPPCSKHAWKLSWLMASLLCWSPGTVPSVPCLHEHSLCACLQTLRRRMPSSRLSGGGTSTFL